MAMHIPYYGEMTIEEMIVLSDVVARVELASSALTVIATQNCSGASPKLGAPCPTEGSPTKYVRAHELKFKVLEYLMGSGDSEVIGISKERIAAMQEELSNGDNSEEYRHCVAEKYRVDRNIQWHIDNESPSYYRTEHELASGMPAGSLVYLYGGGLGELPGKTGRWRCGWTSMTR